jgi:cobalt-zinc-cadmium efflux system membrane fusion protein
LEEFMSQNTHHADVAPPRLMSHNGTRPTAAAQILGWLPQGTFPTLLVVFALAALAYWGHETGWQLPAFSALSGSADADDDDWCVEHAVPESICIECHPNLLPRGEAHGWCSVHGVHECPFEHPDVAQLDVTPTITPDDLERAQRALAFTNRPANSPNDTLHRRRIQFASDEAVRRAGIEVVAAWQQPVREAVSAPGEIVYDATRVANLSAPVAGKVWRVTGEVGRQVQKGEVLALVDAVEVGKAKGELLQAVSLLDVRTRALERLRGLDRSGAVSDAAMLQAESQLAEAQIRLVGAQQALINLGLPVRVEKLKGLPAAELGRRIRFLGLPDAVVNDLNPETTTANLVPVVAPLDGLIVLRKVVAGEQVDTAKALFVVAEPRRLWLTLQVRQEDARLLRARDPGTGTPGNPVQFRPGGSDQEVIGEVAWVSPSVDEKTRTVQVRADVSNPDGQLRAGAFGSGRIILREEMHAVVVPSESIQWEGECHVVFVRDRNYDAPNGFKVFHTRTVRPGAKDGAVTEIIAGVRPGEMVVTQGSGLLRSELLKNNIGEGEERK